MPKRTDIKKIMIIGSGPIIIGQACEFDYSGTQAVKALKEEGYTTILVNSNPATIMTDPGLADRVYIEPITPPYLTKVIESERPDALLPTVGGQTALNVALSLHDSGVLDKFQVEMIGAKENVIRKAEDRDQFKNIMNKLGFQTPHSRIVKSVAEAEAFLSQTGLPIIIRSSFTLGGTGGGICYQKEDFIEKTLHSLRDSPTQEVLIEESIAGWKEYELELMRDIADNVIIICSIENIDPMGIHTGDSITVAPQQTLTDKEYQNLRNMSIDIIREIGVETGGSNIQFAVNPNDGRVMVIEMNPRVSRSSALASKATGFAIARIAAKLSVGYTLDEIPNEITQKTPASFEPTIDYIVVKIPRFDFEKFPDSPRVLDTQMRSVGEVMAIGRTFPESFQKAIRSLELGYSGWGVDLNFIEIEVMVKKEANKGDLESFWQKNLAIPNDQRILFLRVAMSLGESCEFLHELTKIDLWYLYQLKRLIDFEKQFIAELKVSGTLSRELLREAKEFAYSNHQIACLLVHDDYQSMVDQLSSLEQSSRSSSASDKAQQETIPKGTALYFDLIAKITESVMTKEAEVEKLCTEINLVPTFKRVDTCAAEFESFTPYLYSTYEIHCEADVSENKKVLIIGGGPNRIGQGIEFDYCCCHASYMLQEMNIESIMVNSNPETVSTDYDTSDRLYFEPLNLESILNIYNKEASRGNLLGVILQFGGQTPLRLADELQLKGIKILGTSPQAIDRAEDRERFNEMMGKLNIESPRGELAQTFEEATRIAQEIGYPILVRPSYVLGGQSMMITHDQDMLYQYMSEVIQVSNVKPILIDEFLQDAYEVDVDALCDGDEVFVAGIMEHIEQAGVHSGDSACILPTKNIPENILVQIKDATTRIGLELNIQGLLNIQFAVKKNELYALEVNPRASRTVPFVSKSIRLPLAKLATRIIMGDKLKDMSLSARPLPSLYSVKEVVLPFKKFLGVDTILGPEMRSTGEVMGLGKTPEEAFYKAQEAVYAPLPSEGSIFISVNDATKPHLIDFVIELIQHKYKIIATHGTATYFKQNGVNVEFIKKVHDGTPNIVDKIENNEIQFVFNLPTDHITQNDALEIRLSALKFNIPYFTTLAAAKEAFSGMCKRQFQEPSIYPVS